MSDQLSPEQIHSAAFNEGIRCAAGLWNDGRFHPCGFASIRYPSRSRYAKYMRSIDLGNKSNGVGDYFWVSQFGQSHIMKQAFAEGYARILRDNGIKASVWAALD